MFYARLCRVGMMMLLGVLLTSGVGLVVGQLAARQDPPPAQRRSADEQSDKAESSARLSFVPADALGFIHVNVHDLWSLPATKTMREKAGKGVSEALRDMRKNTGVSMDEIQAVTVVILGLEEHRGEPAMVFAVTTTQPYAKDQIAKALGATQERQEGRKTYLAARSGGGTALYFLNDRTFIAGLVPAVRQYLSLGKPTTEGPLASALQQANGQHAIVAAFHVSTPVRMLLGDAMQRKALPAELRFLAPLQNTRGGTAVVDLTDGTARTDVTLRFPDDNDAEEAGDAIKVGLNMLRHALATNLPPQARQDKNIAALLDDLAKTLRNAQVKQQKATVQVRLQGKATPLLAAALPALRRTRQASARVASANNLKQMGLAFHNYADTYQHLPAHAIYSKDGKPLLSWRVAILPFIEQDNLYRQFHLDEPWNSEHNLKLLQSMPKIYMPIQGKAGPYETFYQVFTGRDTIFFDKHGSRFADITDGTSNTIMIVEAGKAVPWTKPDDLPYSPDKPVPSLGGEFGDGFNAAFADGSVHWLPKTIDQTTLRDLITMNDGKPIDWSKLDTPHSYGALQTPKPRPPAIRR